MDWYFKYTEFSSLHLVWETWVREHGMGEIDILGQIGGEDLLWKICELIGTINMTKSYLGII